MQLPFAKSEIMCFSAGYLNSLHQNVHIEAPIS